MPDGDGLTNVEEALYGTNPNNVDSDGDGFSDSVEVINLYNPAGYTPNKLIEAGLVTAYVSTEGRYQIYYPTSWTATDKGNGDVVFDNPQNQPIAVSVADNAADRSVLDWYLDAIPEPSRRRSSSSSPSPDWRACAAQTVVRLTSPPTSMSTSSVTPPGFRRRPISARPSR